ncbi:microaggregate-binding protein 1 [Nocardia altamirensis]|uniref:microaggregate-binding protein 1 n=1 Tax=Nocardia altamirensis TaxID=472158 RepID=UPI0009FFEFD4|nr:CsbD family protein [Nocardia altamirensis]
MSEHGSGPREGVEGVIEGAKGKVKEVAGAVTGDENLKGEGQAQQDKAESELEAAKKEAAAEKARAEADVAEARQAGHRHGK